MKKALIILSITSIFAFCTKDFEPSNEEQSNIELESRSSSSNFSSDIENLSVAQILYFLNDLNKQNDFNFDELLSFHAFYKEYDNVPSIQIEGKALLNNIFISFSAFPDFTNTGSELTIEYGCIMTCVPKDCGSCRQEILRKCKEQRCTCVENSFCTGEITVKI